MAADLCNDVRKMILDRVEKSEDMLLVVISDDNELPHRVMFYVSRNMKDPEHHVRFTVYNGCEKIETTYVLRTKEALRMMVETELYHCGVDATSIYIQGATKPVSLYIDWRCKQNKDEFNDNMHKYVVTHMPTFHSCYDYSDDDGSDGSDGSDDTEHHHPAYTEDIINRILILVSTA